jgi:hypothetical protein
MDCEQFELIGLEGHKRLGTTTDRAQAEVAAEHARTCSRCAALFDSWQEARAALGELREVTQSAQTPQRIEMQLRHAFALKHRSWRSRSTALFAVWALAAATVLFAGVSWWNWRLGQNQNTAYSQQHDAPGTAVRPSDDSIGATLVAGNESSDFTMLPGSLPQETDDAAIVRVRMQRGALSSFGLPVNEERLSDWIQVDLLVGADGQPKAVRLPESEPLGQGESSF